MTAASIAGAKELANSLTFDIEVNGAWIFHLKRNVQRKFDEIRDALSARQKLLLRQVDVIATSINQMCHSTVDGSVCMIRNANEMPHGVKFLAANEDQLLSAIRNYGKISLDGINLALQDLYMRNEDYIMPANDHETMYKCLQVANHQQQLLSEGITLSGKAQQLPLPAAFITNNISHLNESSSSIIEITLPDGMDVLRKANKEIKRKSMMRIPLFNLDRSPSRFAKATGTNTRQMGFYRIPENAENAPKKMHYTPKITINNCNGTINLHNISDLTINYNALNYLRNAVRTCSSIKGMQYLRQLPRNRSSISKDDRDTTINEVSSSAIMKTDRIPAAVDDDDSDDDDDNHNVTALTTVKRPRAALTLSNCSDDKTDDRTKHCDFYSRLLYAIETNFKRTSMTNVKNMKDIVSIDVDMNTTPGNHVNNIEIIKGNFTKPSDTGPSSKCIAFKELGDMKITLKSTAVESSYADDNTQPVQIEQWLTEIVRKTDLEPMQSIDFLEQSPLCYKLC